MLVGSLFFYSFIFASSSVISEVTEIYKQVRVHIGLHMYKRKFISVKYTCRYSSAKLGTFFSATQYFY